MIMSLCDENSDRLISKQEFKKCFFLPSLKANDQYAQLNSDGRCYKGQHGLLLNVSNLIKKHVYFTTLIYLPKLMHLPLISGDAGISLAEMDGLSLQHEGEYLHVFINKLVRWH